MSLGLVDAEVLELLERRQGLDALSDHPLAGAMCLQHRAAHPPALAPVLGKALDEGRPELHIADRKAAEQERLGAALDEAIQCDLAAEPGDGVDEGAARV